MPWAIDVIAMVFATLIRTSPSCPITASVGLFVGAVRVHVELLTPHEWLLFARWASGKEGYDKYVRVCWMEICKSKTGGHNAVRFQAFHFHVDI